MSDFAPQLIQRIQKRMCRLLGAANRKPASSLLRLREFPDFERLPWDPALPALTIQALQLLDGLRQELNDELAWEGGISDCDVLRFALQELQSKCRNNVRQDLLLRLELHLWNARQNKID